MNDKEYEEYMEQRWNELAHDVKLRATAVLKRELEPEAVEFVLASHKKYGREWLSKSFAHFGFGMQVRNLLRENNITDDQTPMGNLDDYYGQMIEAACGLRPIDLTLKG